MTEQPTQPSRDEKRRALLSIIGNGLFLLVFGGGLVFLAVSALANVEAAAGSAGMIVVLVLAYIAWQITRNRRR